MHRFKDKKLLEYEYSIYILIIILKYLLYIAKIHIILIKQAIFFSKKVNEKEDRVYGLPLSETYLVTLLLRYSVKSYSVPTNC